MDHRRKVALLAALAALALPSAGRAQQHGNHPTAPPAILAERRTAAIEIDGALVEEPWRTAPAATDFRQSQPNEGLPATQRTEVRVLFDDAAIYVAARMYDTLGGSGVRSTLVRRDHLAGEADELTVIFDTFHDHLGRTQFTVNPSGVKSDAYGPGGAFVDPAWDPVYELATRVDSLGWTAELRIPLTQLRFPADPVQTWGMQVVRFAARLNERSHWAFWRLNEPGGPNRYGHLSGLAFGGDRPRGLEVLPYVLGQVSDLGRVQAANPFQREREGTGRAGLDLTYRLTSNLSLAATVNPDFGQVEVDPAVVNLGVFETFFSEKRPFFVEGAGLFRFGGLSCYSCSNVSGLSLLHTRRIGRSPQGAGVASSVGRYADLPSATTILGAAKVTGRLGDGWSVGVLDAMTAREHAPIERLSDGLLDTLEVEPFTNYFAARLARDLRGGHTQLRVMATSVVRDLRDSALADRLNRHSEVLGIESDSYFRSRRYRLMTTFAVSQIAGDTGAILRAQRSSARYFQRPDRGQGGNGLFTDRYDPSLTAMRGYAGYARFSKEGGDWLYEAQANLRSPGFEANDLAFNTRVDLLWLNGNLRRRWTVPTSWYRFLSLSAGGQYETNFDGDRSGSPQVHGSVYMDLPNYWWFSVYGQRRPSRLDERLTRGGPAVARPPEWFLNSSAGTDARRRIALSAGGWVSGNADDGSDVGVNASARIRPTSSVALSIGPSWNRVVSRAQFVTSVADSTAGLFYGRRYVFADLDQTTLSMDTRVAMTFSPTLGLEVYLQPLIASAGYRAYKEFARPRDSAKLVYGRDVGTIAADSAGYTVDPDGAGPAATFRVSRPDFTLRSLRGNAILRWEFRPGSTLYFVWTQSRGDETGAGRLDLGDDLRGLTRQPPDNVFLVKVSWWLGL